MRSRALWHAFDQRQTRGWSNVGIQSPGTSGRLKRSTSVTAISKCLLSDLRTRLCYCPRSRCTNRDWDESHAQWLPMRDFIRARTRKRDTHSGYSGCRCPTRKQKVVTENFCSVSGGFVAGKSGEPVVRAVSARLNEDTDCVAACTPV
jgi:hypothetical protein